MQQRSFAYKALDMITKVLTGAAAILASAVMVSACSLVDEDTSACAPRQSGSAIAFTVKGDSTVRTRAAQGTMTLDGSGSTVSLRDRGFGVFACHTGVHPYVSMSTSPNLMYNQLVTFDHDASAWTYSPIVYWPKYDMDVEEYVTFFAYAPHSTRSGGCIADMSLAGEMGDPWILYQLGGGEEADGANGWKSGQTDLVYDFRKDVRHSEVASTVNFTFRHALACAGDAITLTVGPAMKEQLQQYAAASGSEVTLTLKSLTLDYQLTRKGRLVLNGSNQPNWQVVESEDPKVHRYLRLRPDHRLAVASSSTCSVTDYTTSGHGIFFIPVEVGGEPQQVAVTATYQISNGDAGEQTTTVPLSRFSEASQSTGVRLTLNLP